MFSIGSEERKIRRELKVLHYAETTAMIDEVDRVGLSMFVIVPEHLARVATVVPQRCQRRRFGR